VDVAFVTGLQLFAGALLDLLHSRIRISDTADGLGRAAYAFDLLDQLGNQGARFAASRTGGEQEVAGPVDCSALLPGEQAHHSLSQFTACSM
jgi:hypothetical protein